MKFIHLSDLHLGKRVNEFSMIEDQKYIMTKIINIIDEEKPDGVIIAGDVYDKTIPSTDAVELFDDFLVKLSKRKLHVFVISGNHDSAERIAFGNRLMEASGIHMSPVYDGNIKPITIEDEHGIVNVFMLPFIKPAHVRRYFPEAEIESYTDAVKVAIDAMEINPLERNLIVTHQFVTGAARSDSEDISVGGTDNVDMGVFKVFDYVALGHIHRPQNMGSERIRYSGTPLKYSFSEANHNKSVTVVELGEKGILEVKTIGLISRHDMVELKGTYEDLTLKSFYEDTTYTTDYVHITLTDEEDIPDAIAKLRVIYTNLMKLDYDNTRTRTAATVSGSDKIEEKTPMELFEEFYALQNNQEMNDEQHAFMDEIIGKVWGEMQ